MGSQVVVAWARHKGYTMDCGLEKQSCSWASQVGTDQESAKCVWGSEESGRDEAKGKVPVWGLHFHSTHSRKPLDLAQRSYFPSPIPYSPA